jgi:cell division septum initiation protein DivIVA
MGIVVITDKKHRFSQTINVGGIDVKVNSKGHAEVTEDQVASLLVSGFVLENPDQVFKSEEQVESAKKVGDVLKDAEAQAKQIIEKAEETAKGIIAEANQRAGIILQENKVDEKEKFTSELQKLKAEELKDYLVKANVPEEQYKTLKKEDLIGLILKLAF